MELATIWTVVTIVCLLVILITGPSWFRLWLLTALGAAGVVMVAALLILVTTT